MKKIFLFLFLTLTFSVFSQSDSCVFLLRKGTSILTTFNSIHSSDNRYLAVSLINVKGYAYQKNIIIIIDTHSNNVIFEYSTNKYPYLYSSLFKDDILYLREKNRYKQINLLKRKISRKKISRRKVGIPRKYENQSNFDFKPYFEANDEFIFNNSIGLSKDEKCFYSIKK